MVVVISQLALAVFLFFAVNWIGEHSTTFGYVQLSLVARRDPAPAFNFLLKALAPTVFTILAATGLYLGRRDRFVQHIWLVAIYYFAFRMAYNLIMNRAALLNWFSVLTQSAVGILGAYLAYAHLILPRHPLFPGIESIGNQLWIIIALFLYAILNNVHTSSKRTARRKNSYLRSQFTDFRTRYGPIIDGRFSETYMELVAYAILIYETFNRPWVARKIERMIFPWGSHTLGPMQVRTKARISDAESVAAGIQQLKNAFDETKEELVGKSASRYDVIRISLAKYNRDENYISDIFEVLHALWAQVATGYRTEFETMYKATIVAKTEAFVTE